MKWLKLDDLFVLMPRSVIYSIDLKEADKPTAKLVFEIIRKHGL